MNNEHVHEALLIIMNITPQDARKKTNINDSYIPKSNLSAYCKYHCAPNSFIDLLYTSKHGESGAAPLSPCIMELIFVMSCILRVWCFRWTNGSETQVGDSLFIYAMIKLCNICIDYSSIRFSWYESAALNVNHHSTWIEGVILDKIINCYLFVLLVLLYCLWVCWSKKIKLTNSSSI